MRKRGRPRLKRNPTTRFGKMLVGLMDRFGLTQIQLAKAMRINTRTLQRWIMESRKPDPFVVMGVYEALAKLLRRLKRKKQ